MLKSWYPFWGAASVSRCPNMGGMWGSAGRPRGPWLLWPAAGGSEGATRREVPFSSPPPLLLCPQCCPGDPFRLASQGSIPGLSAHPPIQQVPPADGGRAWGWRGEARLPADPATCPWCLRLCQAESAGTQACDGCLLSSQGHRPGGEMRGGQSTHCFPRAPKASSPTLGPPPESCIHMESQLPWRPLGQVS